MSSFSVRGFWSMIGAILLLILAFLVLNNGSSADSLLSTLFNGGNTLAQTLQGR